MSEEFKVVLDAMFSEQVGEEGLKEYARTVASVAEWSQGRPVDEVMQGLTQGWSAVDLNVDPVEAEKLAAFIAQEGHGDFSITTEDGRQLYRDSERTDSGAGAQGASQGGQSKPGAEAAARGVEPPEGPSMS